MVKKKKSLQKIVAKTAKKDLSKKPLTSKRATKKDSAKKPLTSKRATKKDSAKKPLTSKRATKKDSAKKPLTSKRATKKDSAKKPLTSKRATKKDSAKKPLTSKRATKKDLAKKPLTSKRATKKDSAKKPLTSKRATKKDLAKKPLSSKRATKTTKAQKITKQQGFQPEEKTQVSLKSKKLTIRLQGKEKELQKILEKEREETMILKDMQGRTYCQAENCDYSAVTDGYCRIHFFGLYKVIKKKKGILEQDILTKKISHLAQKYSEEIFEFLFKDLSSDKNFKTVLKKISSEDTEDIDI